MLGDNLFSSEFETPVTRNYEQVFLDYLIQNDLDNILAHLRKMLSFSEFLRASSFPLRQMQSARQLIAYIDPKFKIKWVDLNKDEQRATAEGGRAVQNKLLCYFSEIVQICSEYIALNDVLKFDLSGSFTGDLQKAAFSLSELGRDALSFWDQSELYKLFTENGIYEMLNCYNCECGNNLWIIQPEESYGLLDAMHKLLQIILLILLKKVVEDTVPNILERARTFCATTSNDFKATPHKKDD